MQTRGRGTAVGAIAEYPAYTFPLGGFPEQRVRIEYMLSLIYTSKFSLTSFPWQCKWKNMSSFSLTSTLVQKLACYFSDKDTCQGKTCHIFHLHYQGKIVKEKLVKEKLVKENLLVCTVNKFSLTRRLVKENLLGFVLMQISGLGIQQFSPAVLKEDFEATIAVLPVQFSVLLCSRIQYIVSSVRVVVVV